MTNQREKEILTDIIRKINKARNYTEVFSDLSKWSSQYKSYAKLIHPDVCKENGAQEALTKLNSYKEELEKGKTHIDDAGNVKYNVNKCTIYGSNAILSNSKEKIDFLLSFKDKMDIDFQRYIPASAKLSHDDKHIFGASNLDQTAKNSILELELTHRCLPLSSLGILPQGHVNWIFSRMLEFVAYMYKKGYVHAGINPNSVYVEPINHGINVISFYHTTKLEQKLTTASGMFLNFYPEHVRTKKIATPDIDIELCKRTAIYLLGDRSGIGTNLRKTHNNAFLDFMSKRHTDPIQTYLDYREMINKNFEKKFIPLVV